MWENTPNGGWGQQGNQVNVSTRFATSVSDTSMLTIGGWNNSLSLRISPSIGVDGNGNRMYDRNRAFQTALTQDNAKALYVLFNNEIRPLMSGTPEPRSVGVPVGKDPKRSIVSLEMVPTEGGYDMYLVCYTNLDANNVAQEANTFRHRFKKVNGVINYQPNSGTGDIVVTESDFENFLYKLEHIGNLLPISAHGVKYAEASSNSWKNNGGNQGNSFGNTSYGNQNSYGNGASMPAPSSSSNGYTASELPFLS